MSNDAFLVKPATAAPAATAARQQEERTAQPHAEAARGAREEATRAEPDAIHHAARRIENYLKSVSRALEFRVDEPSGRTVVSVRDSATGELIRQIPNEEVLRLAQMAEDQTIVLVSEKV